VETRPEARLCLVLTSPCPPVFVRLICWLLSKQKTGENYFATRLPDCESEAPAVATELLCLKRSLATTSCMSPDCISTSTTCDRNPMPTGVRHCVATPG